MKICAVICEYNPFHTGHLYQLTKIPAKYDKTICVMSGNFVQRAEPAIIGKQIRAETALNAGADMVIENPVINAVANGEKFADGAIKILSRLPDVKGLIMSCETEQTDLLDKIADVQLNSDDFFSNILKESLSRGQKYAAALSEATAAALKKQGYDSETVKSVLNKPNNLLCIEYIKSIRKYNLDISPVILKRKGNDYNSTSVFGNYLSATAIRNILLSGSPTEATPYLPEKEKILDVICRGKNADYALYDALSLYNLRTASKTQLANLYDCGEGLEHSLYDNARLHEDMRQVLESVKSKRYTYARLKRIILQLNLGITKEVMKRAENEKIPFRVLAVKNDFKFYLSEIEKNAVIRNSDYDKFQEYEYYFDIEKRASALYSTITKTRDSFYTDRLITDKII